MNIFYQKDETIRFTGTGSTCLASAKAINPSANRGTPSTRIVACCSPSSTCSIQKNITLVVQDWGGLLGLTLPMESPERFARLIIMNTAFADGVLPSEGFKIWRAFSNRKPDLDLASLHRRGKLDMTEAEANAYSAPYPDATYKAAIRAFPNMVPETLQAPGAEISRRAKA
jgi:pimeloyl-ACP methyl ester carboxylesterase